MYQIDKFVIDYTPVRSLAGLKIETGSKAMMKWRWRVARYERVVLRLSGGLLGGKDGSFDTERLELITEELARVAGRTKLVVVVGGGNITRGRDLQECLNLDPERADQVGMLATIINGYLLNALLKRRHIPSALLCSHGVAGLIPMHDCFLYPERICELWHREHIVIVGGGTGKSGVTTDTAAVRLARSLSADIILKGTNVGGIFSTDPALDPDAEFLSELTCGEFKRRGLKQILDPVVIEELTIPLLVFDVLRSGSLLAAISGRPVGSWLTPVARVMAV